VKADAVLRKKSRPVDLSLFLSQNRPRQPLDQPPFRKNMPENLADSVIATLQSPMFGGQRGLQLLQSPMLAGKSACNFCRGKCSPEKPPVTFTETNVRRTNTSATLQSPMLGGQRGLQLLQSPMLAGKRACNFYRGKCSPEKPPVTFAETNVRRTNTSATLQRALFAEQRGLQTGKCHDCVVKATRPLAFGLIGPSGRMVIPLRLRTILESQQRNSC
jgi:hypothetical protein